MDFNKRMLVEFKENNAGQMPTEDRHLDAPLPPVKKCLKDREYVDRNLVVEVQQLID